MLASLGSENNCHHLFVDQNLIQVVGAHRMEEVSIVFSLIVGPFRKKHDRHIVRVDDCLVFPPESASIRISKGFRRQKPRHENALFAKGNIDRSVLLPSVLFETGRNEPKPRNRPVLSVEFGSRSEGLDFECLDAAAGSFIASEQLSRQDVHLLLFFHGRRIARAEDGRYDADDGEYGESGKESMRSFHG